MKLKELNPSKVFHHQNCLQSCQTICSVETNMHNNHVLIYDSSNGHWLTIPDKKEVGYLLDIRVDEKCGQERITYILEFV